MNRIHVAARTLSDSIAKGKGGLAHIQQLLLTTIWLESTGDQEQAWGTLNEAIMAAVEIGIVLCSSNPGTSTRS
jgi:hypothetical protein